MTKNNFSSMSGRFLSGFYLFFTLCCVLLCGVVGYLKLPEVQPSGFFFGLGIFAVSVLGTLTSLWFMQRAAAQKNVGALLAGSKLIVSGVLLFVALVSLKVDPISLVVGAVFCLIAATLAFLLSARWTKRFAIE